MIINILKNPIIIALIFGTLTYLYIWWTSEKINDDKKKSEARRTSSIYIPIAVAAVTGFLAYMYFGNNDITQTENVNIIPSSGPILAEPENVANLSVNENIDIVYSSSDPTKSFRLLSKGLNIPNNLPDVFIETI